MQIAKDQILDMLRQRGDTQKADDAERELPDQVDTDRDRGMLEKFGLDPKELLGKIGGGIPGM